MHMLMLLRQVDPAAVESQPFEFTLDAWTVIIITSLVVPIIVGLLTKANASAWVKGLVNIILTGIVTLIAANMNDNGEAVFNRNTLMVWIISTVISVASYLGIWQNLPTPGSRPNGINEIMLPKVGVG